MFNIAENWKKYQGKRFLAREILVDYIWAENLTLAKAAKKLEVSQFKLRLTLLGFSNTFITKKIATQLGMSIEWINHCLENKMLPPFSKVRYNIRLLRDFFPTGRKLREYRKKLGYSVFSFARAHKIKIKTVIKCEIGLFNMGSHELLELIAHLGIDSNEFEQVFLPLMIASTQK